MSLSDDTGLADEEVRDYVDSRDELVIFEGRIYSMAWGGDTLQINPTAVIQCPGCGCAAWFDKGRTPCCGEVDTDVGAGE